MKKSILIIVGILVFTGVLGQEPLVHQVNLQFLDKDSILLKDISRISAYLERLDKSYAPNAKWEWTRTKIRLFSYSDINGDAYPSWSFKLEKWMRKKCECKYDSGSVRFGEQTLYDFSLYFVDKHQPQDTMIIVVTQTDSLETGFQPTMQMRLPPFQKGTFEVYAVKNIRQNYPTLAFIFEKGRGLYAIEREQGKSSFNHADNPGGWDITPTKWVKKE